jgi:hypothetical protein
MVGADGRMNGDWAVTQEMMVEEEGAEISVRLKLVGAPGSSKTVIWCMGKRRGMTHSKNASIVTQFTV